MILRVHLHRAQNSMRIRWNSFLLVYSLLAMFVSAHEAGSRNLTGTEIAALSDRVHKFEQALRSSDYESIVKAIPPRVIQYLVASSKLTEAEVIKATTDVMKETFAKVKLDSFAIDLTKAVPKQLPDGTPYMLLPSETVVSTISGEKMAVRTRSHTLAMIDDGEWYLMSVSQVQQLVILVRVYPEYKGTSFPSDSTEVLKE